MRTVGDDVYIQRGETWSLDFEVTNEKGDPYMLFIGWDNPYLAITVTAARYEQEGDFRTTWWLDLSNEWKEDKTGKVVSIGPRKKFIETEALYLSTFSVTEALSLYGYQAGGQMNGSATSDFFVGNYLFYTDSNNDGNRRYKYCWPEAILTVYRFPITPIYTPGMSIIRGHTCVYNNTVWAALQDNPTEEPSETATQWLKMITDEGTYDLQYDEVYRTFEELRQPYAAGQACIYDNTIYYVINPNGTRESIPNSSDWQRAYNVMRYAPAARGEYKWYDYNFRVVKQFNTKDWTEQTYLYDAKVLAGESVAEHVYGILLSEGDDVPELPWTDAELQEQIKLISDWRVRKEMQELYDSGMPIMPTYDTKSIILEPKKLFVSANIQGGVTNAR